MQLWPSHIGLQLLAIIIILEKFQIFPRGIKEKLIKKISSLNYMKRKVPLTECQKNYRHFMS